MTNSWKLKEIVVASMLSAVFGLVLMAWSNIYVPLMPVLGPIGIEILYGLYFVPGILVMYIIRKPGMAVLGSLVAGIVEVLAGSPFGFVNIMVAGIVQGGAAEIVFLVHKYVKYNWVVMMLTGVAAAVLIYVRDFFVFGYAVNPAGVLAGMFIVRIISGALLGGVVSKLLGDALAKTGTLSNFSISKVKQTESM